MNISNYSFLKLQDFLREPIIGIGEYDFNMESEIFGERNDDAFYELPSYNGIYAGYATATNFGNLVEKVCTEIDTNLKYPIDKIKKIEYLRNVQLFCDQKLEKIVLKEINGTFEYDLTFARYRNVSLEELSKAKKFSVYFETTKYIYDSLKYVVAIIQEHLLRLGVNSASQKNRKPRKDFRSFILKPKYLEDNELMKSLKGEMIDNKLIDSSTSIERFRAVFQNQDIHSPIIWIGDKGALKLFISELSKGFFSSEISDIWKIASRCFVFKDKARIDPISFHSIHSSKTGTHNYKNVKSIIRLLEKR